MSDFIKVKFKNGNWRIVHKSSISIFKCDGRFYFEDTNHILAAILFWMPDASSRSKDLHEITREECGRICQELWGE